MKKVFVIIFSLILTVAMPVAAFAAPSVTTEIIDQFGVETEIIDQYTGETLAETDSEGNITEVKTVILSSDASYRIEDKTFIFYTGQTSDNTIFSDVYDLEYTTNPVNVSTNGLFEIRIYKDGELYDQTTAATLTEPGGYVVYLADSNSQVFSFTILPAETGLYNKIELPSMYLVTDVKVDGVHADMVTLDEIDLSKEGAYDITIFNTLDRSIKTMSIYIDHTAPELEIYGLVDGVAKGEVTFGETEKGSTLMVTYNGKEIQPQESYTETGNYVVEYEDSAGNINYYEFQIDVYFDVSTWLIIVIGVGAIIAAIVFIVYNRNHMRIS